MALALAYALAGVAGMILMASAAGCAAVLIAMTARAPDWPRWAAALCWLPALALMAMRFDPRPEIFSLVYLACFLAVLVRVERRPALAWCLPLVQVLWVNTHGLFVLGPIVLGCYLVDRAARAWIGSESPGAMAPACSRERLWRHLLPVSAAVVLACLVNPYGVRGAMFPLELFPKISDPANPYKAYVDEFTSLRVVMLDQMRRGGGSPPARSNPDLSPAALPWSFVLPAAWEKWQFVVRRECTGRRESARPPGLWPRRGVRPCAGGCPGPSLAWNPALARRHQPCGPGDDADRSGRAPLCRWPLAPDSRRPRWRPGRQRWQPGRPGCQPISSTTGQRRYGLSAGTLAYARGRARRSVRRPCRPRRRQRLPSVAPGHLHLPFVSGDPQHQSLRSGRGGRAGVERERMDRQAGAGRPHRIAAWVAPGLVAGLVALWAVGVVTDRYYTLMGDTTHFGLRERPLTFGHDAARFAGRPGLPERHSSSTLARPAFTSITTGPSARSSWTPGSRFRASSTFQTYVRIEQWLNQNDPRWDAAIARLGDPLILISHDGWAEAEAALLTHPRWRCRLFRRNRVGLRDPNRPVFVARRFPITTSWPRISRVAQGAFVASIGESAAAEVQRAPPAEPRRQETGRRSLEWRIPDLDSRSSI